MTQNNPPPKISSLRVSFEMPSSFNSLWNAFYGLFGPPFLTFRLPNVTKSSIKPYHLLQCSDFMALI